MKSVNFDFETGELIEGEIEIEEDYRELARLGSLRVQRDMLLQTSDRYMISDYPMTPAKRAEWIAYRQRLRDLPSTVDPENPAWPKPPTP